MEKSILIYTLNKQLKLVVLSPAPIQNQVFSYCSLFFGSFSIVTSSFALDLLHCILLKKSSDSQTLSFPPGIILFQVAICWITSAYFLNKDRKCPVLPI
jgi:hypothetical protein